MYQNYIFDLYGTLIDIRTDESMDRLWQGMASLYSCYGADYTGEQLRRAYDALVCEEIARLERMGKAEYPEISLGRVFVRLLWEAPRMHSTSQTIQGKAVEDLRCSHPDELIDALAESDWCQGMANAFRVLSCMKLIVYPHVKEVLRKLKGRGCGIYLLSNAQALFTRGELEECGLSDAFDRIYISSDYGIRKPQREFMETLLQENQLDPAACVMIGNDIWSDIRIAAENGVDSIFLNTYAYRKEEIEESISEACPQGYRPRILLDGDIQGVLPKEE